MQSHKLLSETFQMDGIRHPVSTKFGSQHGRPSKLITHMVKMRDLFGGFGNCSFCTYLSRVPKSQSQFVFSTRGTLGVRFLRVLALISSWISRLLPKLVEKHKKQFIFQNSLSRGQLQLRTENKNKTHTSELPETWS